MTFSSFPEVSEWQSVNGCQMRTYGKLVVATVIDAGAGRFLWVVHLCFDDEGGVIKYRSIDKVSREQQGRAVTRGLAKRAADDLLAKIRDDIGRHQVC